MMMMIMTVIIIIIIRRWRQHCYGSDLMLLFVQRNVQQKQVTNEKRLSTVV
jgi:hypothetical protein